MHVPMRTGVGLGWGGGGPFACPNEDGEEEKGEEGKEEEEDGRGGGAVSTQTLPLTLYPLLPPPRLSHTNTAPSLSFSPRLPPLPPTCVAAASALDLDGDGLLSREEVVGALSGAGAAPMSEDEAGALFEGALTPGGPQVRYGGGSAAHAVCRGAAAVQQLRSSTYAPRTATTHHVTCLAAQQPTGVHPVLARHRRQLLAVLPAVVLTALIAPLHAPPHPTAPPLLARRHPYSPSSPFLPSLPSLPSTTNPPPPPPPTHRHRHHHVASRSRHAHHAHTHATNAHALAHPHCHAASPLHDPGPGPARIRAAHGPHVL